MSGRGEVGEERTQINGHHYVITFFRKAKQKERNEKRLRLVVGVVPSACALFDLRCGETIVMCRKLGLMLFISSMFKNKVKLAHFLIHTLVLYYAHTRGLSRLR